MAFADPSVYFGTGDGSILGSFFEKEHGHLFEFSKNPELILAPPAHGGRNMDFPHLVWVGDGTPRHAKVGKTVVHIITNETENGWVVEKWQIKGHRLYRG